MANLLLKIYGIVFPIVIFMGLVVSYVKSGSPDWFGITPLYVGAAFLAFIVFYVHPEHKAKQFFFCIFVGCCVVLILCLLVLLMGTLYPTA